MRNEIEHALDAAKDKGLKIMWIAVRPSAVHHSKLAKYHAVHMEPALSSVSEPEREQIYVKIFDKIKQILDAAG